MTQEIYFGLEEGDLDETARLIEAALQIRFSQREGLAYGDYYNYSGPVGFENIRVFRNWDIFENETIRDPEDMKILIDVEGISSLARGMQIESALMKAIPLLKKIS